MHRSLCTDSLKKCQHYGGVDEYLFDWKKRDTFFLYLGVYSGRRTQYCFQYCRNHYGFDLKGVKRVKGNRFNSSVHKLKRKTSNLLLMFSFMQFPYESIIVFQPSSFFFFSFFFFTFCVENCTIPAFSIYLLKLQLACQEDTPPN